MLLYEKIFEERFFHVQSSFNKHKSTTKTCCFLHCIQVHEISLTPLGRIDREIHRLRRWRCKRSRVYTWLFWANNWAPSWTTRPESRWPVPNQLIDYSPWPRSVSLSPPPSTKMSTEIRNAASQRQVENLILRLRRRCVSPDLPNVLFLTNDDSDNL